MGVPEAQGSPSGLRHWGERDTQRSLYLAKGKWGTEHDDFSCGTFQGVFVGETRTCMHTYTHMLALARVGGGTIALWDRTGELVRLASHVLGSAGRGLHTCREFLLPGPVLIVTSSL